MINNWAKEKCKVNVFCGKKWCITLDFRNKTKLKDYLTINRGFENAQNIKTFFKDYFTINWKYTEHQNFCKRLPLTENIQNITEKCTEHLKIQ